MTIRASNLIQDAYVLANINDPNEAVDGYQGSIGLRTLNTILDQWSSLNIYVPLIKTVTISLTTNVYEYEVTPRIIDILEGNIVNNENVLSVLFPADLKEQNTFNYAQPILGRPTKVFFYPKPDDINATTIVSFYSVPDASYTSILKVKQLMANLIQSEEITSIPNFMFKALMYQMALELSIQFASKLSERFDYQYDLIMSELKAANPRDMTVQNFNTFFSFRRYRPWGSYVG